MCECYTQKCAQSSGLFLRLSGIFLLNTLSVEIKLQAKKNGFF